LCQQQQQVLVKTVTKGVQVNPKDPDYTMDIAMIPGYIPRWVIHIDGVWMAMLDW